MPLLNKFITQLQRIFSNDGTVILLLTLLLLSAIIWLFIGTLGIVFASLFVAYLLYPLTKYMEHSGASRGVAAILTVLLGTVVAFLFIFTLPYFVIQLRGVFRDLPQLLQAITDFIVSAKPYLPSEIKIDEITQPVGQFLTEFSGKILSDTLNVAGGLIVFAGYMILVPIIAFFLLKDRDALLAWVMRFFPKSQVSLDFFTIIHNEFGSYIRGKILEAAIVGTFSWVVFLYLELNYNFALAILVGASVFIPIVGALLVTIPVVLVAYAPVRVHLQHIAGHRQLCCHPNHRRADSDPVAVVRGGENSSDRRHRVHFIFRSDLGDYRGLFLRSRSLR